MTVNAAIAAELPFLRAEAEAMMHDTFVAYAYDWWEIDEIPQQVWAQVGDSVRGKLPSRKSGGDATNARTVTIGGVERTVIEGGLHLAFSTNPAPQVGWEYVLTTTGSLTHPSAVGRRFRVIEAPIADHMTAWRLDVVEVPPESTGGP